MRLVPSTLYMQLNSLVIRPRIGSYVHIMSPNPSAQAHRSRSLSSRLSSSYRRRFRSLASSLRPWLPMVSYATSPLRAYNDGLSPWANLTLVWNPWNGLPTHPRFAVCFLWSLPHEPNSPHLASLKHSRRILLNIPPSFALPSLPFTTLACAHCPPQRQPHF